MKLFTVPTHYLLQFFPYHMNILIFSALFSVYMISVQNVCTKITHVCSTAELFKPVTFEQCAYLNYVQYCHLLVI